MKRLITMSAVFLLCVAQVPTNPAVTEPDKFAWELFIQLSHPAKAGERGVADPSKKLGDPGEAVWETWKLAKGEVFLCDGSKPPAWDAARITTMSNPGGKVLDPPKRELALSEQGDPRGPKILFDPTSPLGNETRMNRAAFDFVLANELYNIEGQEKFHNDGRAIDLPIDAKEVKAAWRRLSDTEVRSGRYHMAQIAGSTYGLVGLHIITKDLPQWTWATFEHVENPLPEDAGGVPYFDRYTKGGTTLPAPILGTKWEHFRLRGTQTSFTDFVGEPIILANTQIEQGFQNSSSCMSCHAHATIGPRSGDEANRLPIFPRMIERLLDPADPKSMRKSVVYGWIGGPDRADFENPATGARRYTQTDFMWSFFRAKRKNTVCK